jgi:predicted transcriptional regulator of viral defense system
MTVSQKIENQLVEIPVGTPFRYQDLGIKDTEYSAAASAISRLVGAGILGRVSKGLFYRPKMTVFGIAKPKEEDLLKEYLFKNGQRIAYITGINLYNKMGLTTQVPAQIFVATKSRRSAVTLGNITIRPTKSYAVITNDNFPLLGILDAIKDFNDIPDKNTRSAIQVLTSRIKNLSSQELIELIRYAEKYPPRVSAFLGALLENTDSQLDLKSLRINISPLSKYRFGVTDKELLTASKWNIK